eukprot:83312-Chlamydomonas_euryale.AAC.15
MEFQKGALHERFEREGDKAGKCMERRDGGSGGCVAGTVAAVRVLQGRWQRWVSCREGGSGGDDGNDAALSVHEGPASAWRSLRSTPRCTSPRAHPEVHEHVEHACCSACQRLWNVCADGARTCGIRANTYAARARICVDEHARVQLGHILVRLGHVHARLGQVYVRPRHVHAQTGHLHVRGKHVCVVRACVGSEGMLGGEGMCGQ